MASVFAAHGLHDVGPNDVVVDIGCGTGLGGQALRCHGTFAIDGIDISPEMLGQAAAKALDGSPVYRTLIEADLTQRIPVDDATYAGVMSVGTFTHGHVGHEALAEVIRIIRPGGRAAIGINAAHFAAAGFGAAFDQLVTDGRIGDARADRPADLRRRGHERPRQGRPHRRLHRHLTEAEVLSESKASMSARIVARADDS